MEKQSILKPNKNKQKLSPERNATLTQDLNSLKLNKNIS